MYFDKIDDMKELKKAYRTLAMKYHPDHGGDVETMKAVNAEYEEVFKAIKAGIKAKTHSTRIDVNAVDDGFRDVLGVLLGLDGIEVELCGEWLWIGGDTRAVKEDLKKAGCMWSAKKKLWYWRPEWCNRRFNRKPKDMATIRAMYGSSIVTGTVEKREQIA